VNADPALVLEGVTKTFVHGSARLAALSDIGFTARAGKITGLIGPDGAGKTTLMRLAAGLLLPDSGAVEVLGVDMVRVPLQAQSELGYMPQRFGLYEDLSVQENLDLYADLHGVDRRQRPQHYAELMHMTGLAPFSSRLAGRLSGGMKQKLGLACTLVRAPSLLLLDEPTVGVDPVSRRELWAIINRLVEQQGLSVLLSTAYLDEAERCDDVILLHEGHLMRQGSPQALSAPMRGRTYHVSSATVSKRVLQNRLSRVPAVLDAVIDNEQVRIVGQEDGMPSLGDAVADVDDIRVVPTEPIFEDTFMALLKPERAATRPAFAAPQRAAGSRDDQVIAVDKVERRFGDFYAVKDVSFTVRRGEVFGLLGANGAGKSTTFRMLCGLLPVSAGQLTVAGHDLRRAGAQARSHLGYMAQRFSLYVDLTVTENLNFFAKTYGLGGVRRRSRIAWALTVFDLGDYADSKSGDLPLGYKQRLAMAAALMHEPEILFLDEPTSGVDPLARREFWQHINALAESGVTVLVTTHFMDEADYCDRLVIMAEGEVLATGTPAELKARFRSAALPAPTMEDAFIGLIERREQAAGAAA
jgi:ABC-2 type transport system ATP-binding protein